MKDFPILPILLILYVIAVSGRKKKKNKQKQTPARAASRADARRERTMQTAQGFHTAFERTQRASAFDKAQRTPVPEGEDPCHPAPERADARMKTPESDDVQMNEPQTNPLAQDLLRGVIMSEILTRPSESRARNRQGYHG